MFEKLRSGLIGFEIDDAKKTDIQYIIDISVELFGENYLNKTTILQWFDNQYNIRKAVYNSQIVGFYISKTIFSVNDIEEKLLPVIEKTHKLKLPAAYLKLIGVRKKFQAKGIGKSMLNHFLSIHRCNYFFTTVWISKNENRLISLLREKLFMCDAEMNHYWHNESIQKQYNCIDCGAPPCMCAMQLFSLVI